MDDAKQESLRDFEAAFQRGQHTYRTPAYIDDERGDPFAIVPEGCEVFDMSQYLGSPTRIKTSKRFFDSESFAAYVNDYDTGAAKVFADVSGCSLRATIDYHGKDAPSWCEHEAVLTCELSDDWQAWIGSNNKELTQVFFANFLEDRIHNVVEPDAAHVMQTVKHLEVNKAVIFKSAVTLQDGSFALTYVESAEDQSKATMKIPSKFVIGVNPFKFGKPWELSARLRYRIPDGKLTFTYLLDRPEQTLEKAFRQVVEEVEKKVKCAVYLTA